jgi:hypothetical protein
LDGSFNTTHPYDDLSEIDEVGPIKRVFLFCYFYHLFHFVENWRNYQDDILLGATNLDHLTVYVGFYLIASRYIPIQ